MRMSSSKTAEDAVIAALSSYVRKAGALGTDAFGSLSGAGAIAELEGRLADSCGMRHAVCMPSATAGLASLVLALELDGSEIVTAPISYGATVAPLIHLDCKVAFADVEPGTLGLDAESVRRRIGPETRAILAVDVLGVPADSRALRAIADEAGVWYLADAAQSLGASRDGRPASGWADALVVSFSPGKTVFSGGEGGAVVTDNDDIYERLVWWTQHPYRQARELGFDQLNEFGMNGRMHPAAATWANAVFDESLRRLAAYQERCFAALELLDESGWIESVDWRAQGIRPAFFRLSAAWGNGPRPRELEEYLARRECEAVVCSLPVHLLNIKPRSRRAIRSRQSGRVECPVAERELPRRFALSLLEQATEKQTLERRTAP